ncbi:MAG: hypothetical protein ABIK44_02895 [candidate division WOR-3 bacterium]
MEERLTVPAELHPAQQERWQALIDILYLGQLVYIYVFAAIYPLVGIVYGILFTAAGVSPKTKRIGRICLILGIINLALCLLIAIGLLVLGLTGVLAGLAGE